MSEVPERWRHLDERVGLTVIGQLAIRDALRAIRRSVPTMEHAVRLFDAVAYRLGARCFVDPEGGEHRLRLHLVDENRHDWIVPTALLECAFSSGISTVIGPTFVNKNAVLPADAPADWKPGDPWFGPRDPAPQLFPRGPNMRAGMLRIQEGASHLELRFDDRGLIKETVATVGDDFTVARYDGVRPFAVDPYARPPQHPPIGLFARNDLPADRATPDALVSMIVQLDAAKRTPARVRMPAQVPGGIACVWSCGLPAIRRAVWSGAIPSDARWVLADGFDGKAVSYGATFDEAWERRSASLFRAKPRPPVPQRLPDPLGPPAPDELSRESESKDGKNKFVSLGTFTVTMQGTPGAVVEWPAAVPRNIPTGGIELPALPAEIPRAFAAVGFSRWGRFVGQFGHVHQALVRDEPAGFTLVGEHIFDAMDAATVADEMARCDREQREEHAEAPKEMRPWENEAHRCSMTRYSCWDSGRRRATPLSISGGDWAGKFDAASLDGDQVAWSVVRVRTW